MTLRFLESHLPPRWVQAGSGLVWFLRALWDQVRRDQVVIRASGLAYASLLATVPLVAVMFGLLSAFGALSDLKELLQVQLVERFLPSHQAELMAFLDRFLANASRVGLVGFVFLVVTAILLLDAVESNFNEIYHVANRRRLVAKITAYTSVLVFGSLLIGASLSISARIETALLLEGSPIELGLVGWLQQTFFPPFLSLVGFLVMYLVIPYTRVHRGSALLGALVGAVLWEATKGLFADSIGQSVRISTLYGTLAAIPIFLIWLNITWIIVLVGLEIAFTHQHRRALQRESLWQRAGSSDRLALALKIYAAVAAAFDRGDAPPTDDELADRFLAPLANVQELLTRFEHAGLLRRASVGDQDEGAMPSRPLGQVKLTDVLRLVLGGEHEPPSGSEDLAQAAERAVDRFEAAGYEALGAATFEDLVRPESEEPAASPPAAPAGEA